MKIPPRAMFNVQVVGTIIAVFVYTITAWWLMDTIPCGLTCDTSVLPSNSPLRCPMHDVFYDASVIWGARWSTQNFRESRRRSCNNLVLSWGSNCCTICCLVGVQSISKTEMDQAYHMAVLLCATAMMPPASAGITGVGSDVHSSLVMSSIGTTVRHRLLYRMV